jgi:hypothetical protein
MKTRLISGLALACVVSPLSCGRTADEATPVEGTGGDGSVFGVARCAPLPGENPHDEGPWVASGTVTTADGASLVGVTVNVSGGTSRSYQTNILGRYQIHLTEGNYELQVGDAACAVTRGGHETLSEPPPQPAELQGDGPACTSATLTFPTSSGGRLLIDRWAENPGDPRAETSMGINSNIGWSAERSQEFIDEILASNLGPLCETTIGGYPALEYLPILPADFDTQPPTMEVRTYIPHAAGFVSFTTGLGVDAPDEWTNFLLVSVRNLSKDDVDEIARGN